MNRSVLIVASIGFAFAAIAHADNLIVNGSFESGSSGWNTFDPDNDGSTLVYCGGYNGARPNTGSGSDCFYWGGEVSGLTGWLKQTGIPTEAGAQYTLSFYMMNFLDSPDNPLGLVNNQFSVLWNGLQIYSATNIPATDGYTQYTFTVGGSDGNASGTLEFDTINPPSAILLDDISVEQTSDTPEPSTVYLAGIAATLLGVALRLRRSD